jgi:hypothetical protein
MIHHGTDNGGHYGVSRDSLGRGILIQVQDEHAQARELLTQDEAIHLAYLLLQKALEQ